MEWKIDCFRTDGSSWLESTLIGAKLEIKLKDAYVFSKIMIALLSTFDFPRLLILQFQLFNWHQI